MEYKLLVLLLVLTLVEVNRRSFVDTAPLNDESRDEVVTELEDLKRILGDKTEKPQEISFSKSRSSLFVDHNGQKSGFNKVKSEIDKNGKVIAKIKQKMEMVKSKNGLPKSVTKTEVEIPSKGIYDVTVNGDQTLKNEPQKSEEAHMEKTTGSVAMEYSPLDMAEYIYWTGDEKNVALMIEEFLEKGFMSRQEAINYLQSIKFNLDLIQNRDQNLQKIDKKNLVLAKQSSYENPSSSVNYDKNVEEYNKYKNSVGLRSPTNPSRKVSETDDMNDGTERMRLHKEYSLEEIIYQLAKVIFSQSLNRGSSEAQTVLHKLVTYLQKEVKNGQVSINLQRKLLDVLFAALTDTLLEQTESMVAKKEDLLNLIDAYSTASDSSDQLFPPDIEDSLDTPNTIQRSIQKKNGTKASEL